MQDTACAPTIAERYSTALESTHLGLRPRRGDVDYLIAANLPGPEDGRDRRLLGAMLYRLCAEYDAVRGEHRAAEQRLIMREQEARKGATADRCASLKAAEGEARTAHVLILAQLGSLAATKQRFGAWAVVQATRQRYMHPDEAVLRIAGRVLSYMLDSACRQCGGTGTVGGYSGGPASICTGRHGCGGSGKRGLDAGKSADDHKFARHLLAEAERMMSDAAARIRPNLRHVDAAKEMIATA